MSTTERPADFDAAVMAYRPGLLNLARRYKSVRHYEDLVTDTIICALENWQSYRPDGGMWKWLSWLMRGVVSNQATAAARQKRTAEIVPIDRLTIDKLTIATPPNQEHHADLTRVVGKLEGRDGDVLLRRALGEPLIEICRSHGISSERGRQLEARARSKLKDAA